MKQEKPPSSSTITIEPFPASQKIYVKGYEHNISVAMREITIGENGNAGQITVYDTSGPYTDPKVNIDVQQGLERLREPWVIARKDTDLMDDLSSDFGRKRLLNTELDHFRFEQFKKPLKASKGCNGGALFQRH